MVNEIRSAKTAGDSGVSYIAVPRMRAFRDINPSYSVAVTLQAAYQVSTDKPEGSRYKYMHGIQLIEALSQM